MAIQSLVRKAYELLIYLSNFLQPIVLLVFRLYWGWQFFVTGKGKLENHDNVVEFFSSLGIPAPGLKAWFVGGVECFGGLFLLVGLCSRPVALVLSINMLVAYLSVAEDRAAVLNIFADPAPFLAADPFFFLLTSVVILAFGPGAISIDALLKRRLERTHVDKTPGIAKTSGV